MRNILTFLIMFMITGLLIAQDKWDKFEEIVDVNSTNPSELSEKITSDYDDELDKIQSIYYWITHNIKYDYKALSKRQDDRSRSKKYTLKEWNEKLEKEIVTTLKKKKGVCQNYTQVFESLCQHAGIEAERVMGFAKYSPSVSSGLGESHAWNAVKYKDEWHLIDPTFGSGFINNKNKFEFKFDPGFFFVDATAFGLNHFPRDSVWQLTDKIIGKEEFKTYPFIGSGYIEYGLSDLEPLNKKIEVTRGDNLEIRFKTLKEIGEIKCYHMSSGKRIFPTITKEDQDYLLTIESNKVKSGKCIFLADGNILFVFKIVK